MLSVAVRTVGYACLFRGYQIFLDFVSFLSMIINEVLTTCCLRYNICSAWFLDIRISTCHSRNLSLNVFLYPNDCFMNTRKFMYTKRKLSYLHDNN